MPADPNRTTSVQIADDDSVLVALADRDVVDAERPRCGHARTSHLLGHVELVQVLDRAVVEPLGNCHRLVRHLAAQRSDVQGVPSRVARILRKPVQSFYEHAATPRAIDSPTLQLQVDPPTRSRQVSNPACPLVVSPVAPMPTTRAGCRFFRRRRTTMRAYRSPNTPSNRACATKPGSEKRALRDRGCFTAPDYRDPTRSNFSLADSSDLQPKTRQSRSNEQGSGPLKSAETQLTLLPQSWHRKITICRFGSDPTQTTARPSESPR